MKKIIMVLTNSFDPDIRVLKEATYLSEKNFTIEILCWERTHSNLPKQELINKNLFVKRFTHPSVPGSGLRQIWPYIKFINSIRKYQKGKELDFLHCHDFDGLLSGYLALGRKQRKFGFSIIYDAHEYEIGRNTNFKRGKVYLGIIKLIEKYLISKVENLIFVSEYQKKEMNIQYKLNKNSIILRNIPPNWSLNSHLISERRNMLLSKFSANEISRIIMFHGIITHGRGIEQTINSLPKIHETGMVILGNGSSKYIQELKDLCLKMNVSSRVIFEERVNYDNLWVSVGASDLGIILISDQHKSLVMSLPNKLFENIQSLTPVIVSNFPAMSEITEKYGIGITANPNNIEEITSKINYLFSNQDNLNKFKRNLKIAKKELNWEREIKKIDTIYKA